MAEATEKTQGRMAAATEKTEKTMIQMVAEIRKLTGKNIGAKTIKDLKEQKVALDAQQTELENMRKGIEELGGVAEQDSNYNKMVVDYASSNIGDQLDQYDGYLQKISSAPVPMEHPRAGNTDSYTYDMSNIL